MNPSKEAHWEKVYQTKAPHEVSWTQDKPTTSLKLIEALNLPKSAAIIDIGGGDSKLVDHLLALGYTNLSVLDISAAAIKRAKQRLGDKAKNVEWIVSDVTAFKPHKEYAVWHDRAALHFLTSTEDLEAYLALVNEFVSHALVIAAFSTSGPLKCSGLEVRQYDAEIMQTTFQHDFTLGNSFDEVHETPFKTNQQFIYAVLNKKE